MAEATLILSFAPCPNGRERAESLIQDLLTKHDLGKISGGGQDLRSGAFDIEITTTNAEALFAEIEAALEAEPDLKLEDATSIER